MNRTAFALSSFLLALADCGMGSPSITVSPSGPLQLSVATGLVPPEALAAATHEAARFLGNSVARDTTVRRRLEPTDLFQVERIGAIAWSANRTLAAIEIHRPGRWLDRSIPTADMVVLDVASGALRTVSPSVPGIIGFFRPSWSPDGLRLAFLSLDENADVRLWLWVNGSDTATPLTDLKLHDGLADPPVALWHDAEHVITMARDPNHPNEGLLYFAIHRGRNVADAWARARAGTEAAVAVLDSRGTGTASQVKPPRRIVSINVTTQAVMTIAAGELHQPTLSPDGRTLTYRSEDPPFSESPVASFLHPDARGDSVYGAVNWGRGVHRVDLSPGVPVTTPPAQDVTPPTTDQPTLRTITTPTEGSRLVLTKPERGETIVWQGNAWVRGIQTGHAEAIAYQSSKAAPLTGWILYPPNHTAGTKIPLVTFVYPGSNFDSRTPNIFDILNSALSYHTQLFAALGYGVVLPSMPIADALLSSDALDELGTSVFPLLDTLIRRGIADSGRIAVVGQSAGGWAALGLITQTDRFRTAIAIASYANLTSLYGTFYGQYRHGDAGSPQRAQVLRMLQLERAFFGAGAPPWERPEPYRMNSPLWRAANVRTPVMLVHGDADFIPVQQAEEFFTALYRQDKRVRLVRYHGEGHEPALRPNVIDFWQRVDEWLRETMPP